MKKAIKESEITILTTNSLKFRTEKIIAAVGKDLLAKYDIDISDGGVRIGISHYVIFPIAAVSYISNSEETVDFHCDTFTYSIWKKCIHSHFQVYSFPYNQ